MSDQPEFQRPEEEPPALSAMVEKLKRRKAEIEAEKARAAEEEAARIRAEIERRRAQLPEDDEPKETYEAGALSQQIAEMLSRITPVPEEEIRKRAFEEEIKERLQAWRFPERYHYEIKDWKEPKQRIVYEICAKTLQRIGAVVALVGMRGVGKTTIAAQLAVRTAWEDWERGRNTPPGTPLKFRSIQYWKLNDLIAKFKPLYADFGSIRTEELIAYRDYVCGSIDLMVIDEVHDCDDLRTKNRALTDLIDRRYSRCLDTVLISNQTQAEFEASTEDSVLSRLNEHGAIIQCAWRSFRDK